MVMILKTRLVAKTVRIPCRQPRPVGTATKWGKLRELIGYRRVAAVDKRRCITERYCSHGPRNRRGRPKAAGGTVRFGLLTDGEALTRGYPTSPGV